MFGLRKRRRSKDSKTGGRKGSTGRSQSPIRTARRIFHGVCINADAQEACEAARELTDVRFLADDAPMLPLRDCTNPSGCRCKYQHFDDRRTDARRESDIGLPVKDHPNDVRSGVGRRVTDS